MASVSKREGRAKPWVVSWRDRNGKQHTTSFATKREARDHAAEVELEERRGGGRDPGTGRILLSDFYAAHRDEGVKTRGAKLTGDALARDAGSWTRYIEPAFGNSLLADIHEGDVQRFVDRLCKTLRPSTVQREVGCLSRLLSIAVREGRLNVNPCAVVHYPKADKVREQRAMSPAELAALEEAFPPEWAVFVPFVATTGLRIGEVAALRWRHIDFARSSVLVEEGWTEAGAFGATKSRRPRTVDMLTPDLVARLRERRGDAPDDAFVFGGERGGNMRPNAFRARVWRPAVERARLDDVTPHTLRHTACSLWLDAGIPEAVAVLLLGHRDAGMVRRIYAHQYPVDHQAERDALAARLSAPPANVLPLRKRA